MKSQIDNFVLNNDNPFIYYVTWEEWERDEYEDARMTFVDEQIDITSPDVSLAEIAVVNLKFPAFEQWILENDARLTELYPHRPLYTTRQSAPSVTA